MESETLTECPEYVGHRPKGDGVPDNFFLTPVDNPQSSVWYKMTPVGRNTLANEESVASIASLDDKFTNSSGLKRVVQTLRHDFDPLEISELTGHANPEFISSYSHNPLDKQRKMSNKLASFTANNNSDARHALQEVSVDSSAQIQPATTSNTAATVDTCTSRCMAGAVAGLFTEVTFNNSPVNISINFQSNVNPQSGRFL